MSWRYLYSKHIIGLPPVDGGECVRLVQHYIPEIDNTKTWERGESVITSLKLARGMAIANFTKDGKWPGHPHNNHACMLWDWGGRNATTGEVSWIEIVEQFVGLPSISLRRLQRHGKGVNPSNNADEFYVIEHKGRPHETRTSASGPPAHHHIGDKCPDRNEGEAMLVRQCPQKVDYALSSGPKGWISEVRHPLLLNDATISLGPPRERADLMPDDPHSTVKEYTLPDSTMFWLTCFYGEGNQTVLASKIEGRVSSCTIKRWRDRDNVIQVRAACH